MKNKEDRQRPSLEQVQKELQGTFTAIGVLLNESFYPGSGDKLIGVPLGYGSNEGLLAVDLSRTVIGRYLPIYYTYAYDGRVIPRYEDELDESGENMERLADFAWIFRSDSAYFDLCLDVAGLDIETDVGHLQDMIDRLRARRSLDAGSYMSIGELAVLADMSERSVRNALAVEGTGRLNADKSGNVENAEARRWLQGRRGFVPTRKKEFPGNLDECPDQLDALEIPPFVQDRLIKRFAQNELDKIVLETASSPHYDRVNKEYPEIIQKAAKAAGLGEESIRAPCNSPSASDRKIVKGLRKQFRSTPSGSRCKSCGHFSLRKWTCYSIRLITAAKSQPYNWRAIRWKLFLAKQ